MACNCSLVYVNLQSFVPFVVAARGCLLQNCVVSPPKQPHSVALVALVRPAWLCFSQACYGNTHLLHRQVKIFLWFGSWVRLDGEVVLPACRGLKFECCSSPT